MPERHYRVLAVAAHPVQYMAPIFRRMARHPQLDLHVAYCSLRGAEAAVDVFFGRVVQWDVPLLDGYDWTHVPNKGSGNLGFFGLCNPGLRQLIHDGHFDAILCFVGYVRASFWISRLAAFQSDTRFLFGTDATSLAARDRSIWKRNLKRFVWPGLFRLADQVIVPSSGGKALMLSLGIPEERVTLTPYSVDNEWWFERAGLVNREAVRQSWGANSGDVVILFCAKLQPWKRPLDLLRAFATAGLPNGFLVFAGDGPLWAELQAEAEKLGIAARVRFLGFVNQSQLPDVYASADVMVIPSEYEPFAVVVNEAMCCGCPVIASDRVGAARDLVAPISQELIFPSGDVPALAKVLHQLASEPSQLVDLGRRGRARITSWSPRENIAATLEAIQAAVSRSNRGAARC
jgi:glycosyltransferase involved in cell wall biosynthesis